MAKNAPVKKSKRRLKRSVRRSVAAVLMITAIGVAAVPVPENVAAPEGRATDQDKHKVYSYKELKTGYEGGDKEGNAISDDGIVGAVNSFKQTPNKKNEGLLNKYYDDVLEKVGKGENSSLEELEKNLGVLKSYKITDQRGKTELTWEYKFYTSGSNVILCEYNDDYPVGSLDLDKNRFPNGEYFNVSSTVFESYFSTGFTQYPEANPTLKMEINPVDSLTATVTYTYKNYKSKIDGSDPEFFNSYASRWLNEKKALFASYEADENAWLAQNPDKSEQEYEEEFNIPGDVDTPGTFTTTMSAAIGNDIDKQKEFFRDKCTTLQNAGSGYNLVPVSDTRDTTANPPSVYVAYGGTPKTGKDVDGYLVLNQYEQVSGIGKQAFADVVNVTSIILPENVKYIADEAFIRSSSITGVKIDNVEVIGNNAFQSCSNLSSVELGSNVRTIGVEAFNNCQKLETIIFSPNTQLIGAGAFADCIRLVTLNLNNINFVDGAEIGAAAFYNCEALSTVNISNSTVIKIGDSAFATESRDVMTEFVFPAMKGGTNCLGNRLFSGRTMLQNVVFPSNYGRGGTASTPDKIPESMFHDCGSLKHVEFPTQKGADPYACARLDYDSGILFADVGEKSFYVSGPELVALNGNAAYPRVATWNAVTGYYSDSGYVPYHYYDRNGVEYYEICSGEYLLSIRKNGDGTGTLISCRLKPNTSPSGGTLIIPDMVGDTEVTAIDTDCFSDTELTSSVQTLVINDHIKSIADSTFENVNIGGTRYKWGKLKEATIGSAVESIGANAFLNCDKLEDITFKTPVGNDYTKLKLGTNALKTNGAKLTIHGDIHKGYSPFEYAVNPSTYVISSAEGVRVCYQSRWDSPESKHMTVMYGDSSYSSADGSTGYVTLLDYPKYSELEDLNSSAELRAHNDEREQQFYNAYASEAYDSKRDAFAAKWLSVTTADDLYKDIFPTTDEAGNIVDPLYGPWINEEFCKNFNANYRNSRVATDSIFDVLFEPIVAQALEDDPEPYFDKHPYSFMDNYKKYGGDATQIPKLANGTLMDYMGWNDFERGMIASVEDIVIPEGIESIDICDFRENNAKNFVLYGKDEYTDKGKDGKDEDATVIPGLFSGLIKDYGASEKAEGDVFETMQRGNDRIKSVTMSSVVYLPDYAFDNCERLDTVILGSAMESVGALPFRDCMRLTNLTGNAKFPAENGILYETLADEPESYKIIECLMARGNRDLSSDISNLMAYNDATDTKIPYVSEIAEKAFEDCDYITEADFRKSTTLKEILDGTFKDCNNLARIYLPVSVNNIKDDAFSGVRKESKDIPKYMVWIPGNEVSISDDAFGTYPGAKRDVEVWAYADTAAYRYAEYYEKDGMTVHEIPAAENTYVVVFIDYDGTLIDTKYVVNDTVEPPDTTELEEPNHRPGYTFAGWLGTNGQDIRSKITGNCTFIAQYDSDGTMVNGKYVVEFLDNINGEQISGRGANQNGTYSIEPGTSFMDNDIPTPTPPAHEGYTFLQWSHNWTENTIVNSNMTIIALYSVDNTSGGSTNTPGTGSSGSTNTPGGSSGTTSNSSSNNSTSSTTSSSSDSTSSTSSGSDSTGVKYTVTVENGSGSGSYEVGSTVVITANEPAPGMVFQKWTTESNGVMLASVSMTATTFTMPANNVTVTANYVAGTAATSAGNTGNPVNTGDGSTRVDITKPGISNKDLATANVNGSTDNFIVKITETDEATRAVSDALTNKYGSLDNILYYAMDISLYDSTGTYKITDTSGLSVDITIPIPDALVAYGGNNMAGAVINGNQLENLNENFTTINGVPCIRFTATHFSPYTVYVDTGNLTEGMLDTTPKTGDPIHPKWFLSIGLACLSIILFMKKDKAVKVKTA